MGRLQTLLDSGFIIDFLQLIDVNGGGFRLRKGQELYTQTFQRSSLQNVLCREPQMWVRPQMPFGPPPPQGNWRTSHSPSLPTLSIFPRPPILFAMLRVGVAQTVFLVNRVFVPCQKRAVLTKTAKITNLHPTHWKQGLRSSDPQKRRKWRKWRVSLRKRHGLEKKGFVLPWPGGAPAGVGEAAHGVEGEGPPSGTLGQTHVWGMRLCHSDWSVKETPTELQTAKDQKCPQYCWGFHDRLWEALSGTTSEKRGAPSRTGGRQFWKCSGGLKCLEL